MIWPPSQGCLHAAVPRTGGPPCCERGWRAQRRPQTGSEMAAWTTCCCAWAAPLWDCGHPSCKRFPGGPAIVRSIITPVTQCRQYMQAALGCSSSGMSTCCMLTACCLLRFDAISDAANIMTWILTSCKISTEVSPAALSAACTDLPGA